MGAMSSIGKKGLVISDLRERPEFFARAADRIWRAWWKPGGYPLDDITERLRENLLDQPIPFALIASDGSKFVGTASVIPSDMAERPQYSPWVAAVWTEPEYRNRGVGAALVDRAVQTAFGLGYARTFLCAAKDRREFYTKRAWTQIEDNVGKKKRTILVRDAN
jgi:GNAT superfamily N-acetyltransferase